MLSIEIGEDVAVRRDGVLLPLPRSRQTRALLAFLAFQSRPVSREWLSGLFWEHTSDPRAGLRWALAKIRRILGANANWLDANRLTVWLKVPPDSLIVDRTWNERLLALTLSGSHDAYGAWVTQFRERMIQGGSPHGPRENDETSFKIPDQEIRYTLAADGTRIAYARMGQGPPILKSANWLSHLREELSVPFWSGLCMRLSSMHTLYRYDERGSGLSDWDVSELGFDAFVSDLECVADAVGLERFPLVGISQGGAVSIEYAARHPERVSALILLGAYPSGWRHAETAIVRKREAEMTLVEEGWGDDSPAYRQIFSHSFMPDASAGDIDRFNHFQRQTTSPANAARFIDSFGDIDVRHRLAAVRSPALVLHSAGDRRISAKVGEKLAASMPDAVFVPLPTANHIPLSTEPAFEVMAREIEAFLATHRATS